MKTDRSFSYREEDQPNGDPAPEAGSQQLGASSYSLPSRSKWNPLAVYLRFRRRRIITVEPVMFLYMFALFSYLFVTGQYVFNKFGREKYREYNYTGSFNFCITTKDLDHLGKNTDLGDKVEEENSGYNLVVGVTGQLPSIFAGLLYGPLSDRTGRRLVIVIIALVATVTGAATIVVVHYDWSTSLHYLIGLSVIVALGGSLTGMLTATFSYIADISSNKLLTVRFGILEAMIFIGGLVSFATTGVWLNKSGCNFKEPLILYVACNAAIILYTLFYLPESLSKVERKAKRERHSAGLQSITRGFKIFFSQEYSRWRLWFALLSMACYYTNAYGFASVISLYLLGDPLQWEVGLIGWYLSLQQAMFGIGLLVVLPLLVVLRIPDGIIIIIGGITGAVSFALTGFVATTWQMFALSVLQGVGAVVGPPLRGTMSRAVAIQDQGPLFSIIAAVQIIMAVIASVIFSFLYPFSIHIGWTTGSIFFLMAAIAIVPVPFVIVLFIFRNGPGAVYRQEPKPEPDEEEEEVDPDEELTSTGTQELLCDLSSLESSRRESGFRESGVLTVYGSIN